MTQPTLRQSIFSATALDAQGKAPEWVHLVPSGVIRTVDGRGPFSVASMSQLATTSLPPGERLPIDENHATDLGAKFGMPAPARGWIVALQARSDGLWGKVEWSGEGQRLLADKAYVGISPALLHTADGRVMKLLRASLTNVPNLQGLTALHSAEQSGSQTLTETDRKMAHVFGMSEGQWAQELAGAGLLGQTSLHSETVADQASNAATFNETDRLMMHIFGASEADWAAAMAASRREGNGE